MRRVRLEVEICRRGIMLGVAAALGIGGALADAGVDWRVAFAISAVAGFSSLPLLRARVEVAPGAGRSRGDLRRLLRSLPEWRLLFLFVAILAVPLGSALGSTTT